jgi:hypothetical protein
MRGATTTTTPTTTTTSTIAGKAIHPLWWRLLLPKGWRLQLRRY